MMGDTNCLCRSYRLRDGPSTTNSCQIAIACSFPVHCRLRLCLGDNFVNHFSMTGCCTGPLRCETWIRQAARPAIVTSSFIIFLTQTFPLYGATSYILPSRTMSQLSNGLIFVYRSVEVYGKFCSYLLVLVRIRNIYTGGRY